MTEPETARPAAIGEILGGYLLQAVLGEGGMGCVYLGVHERLGRKAAVKVLATELARDAQFVSRFFQEAKLVNEIRHPNIIDVLDFVDLQEPRRVAFVMELLEGAPLSKVLEARRLSLVQAVNVCYQLGNALEAVHQIGAVHRDLKPDNIYIVGPIDSDLGMVPSVKILDFGIAKSGGTDAQHRTRTGMILGTPSYMAPEQITAEPVSPGTDVYALGEVFYEMLSGRRIFSGGETSGILRGKLIGDPGELTLPDELSAKAPIQRLVRSCLALRPEERPSTGAFKAALLEILALDGVKSVPAAVTLERPQPTLLGPPRAKRSFVPAIGVSLAILAAGVIFWPRPEVEPQVEALAPPPPESKVVERASEPTRKPARAKAPPREPPRARVDDDAEDDLEQTVKPKKRSGSSPLADEVRGFESALQDAADRLNNELELTSAETLARRGEQALRANEYERAKQAYKECLQKQQRPECHRGLGYVYRAQKARKQSNIHFARYLELRPDAPDAEKIVELMTQ